MPVSSTHFFSQPDHPQSSQGFTLVELMIVIVILSLFAAVVSLSVGGSQKRQQMQYYDKLVDDLKLAKFESLDQSRVIGLVFLPENATRHPSYGFLSLSNAAQDYIYRGGVQQSVGDASAGVADDTANIAELAPDKLWQPEPSFTRTELPPSMRMEVSELTWQSSVGTVFNNAVSTSDSRENNNPLFADTSRLPDVLWYGNGEVTPVKIQLFFGDDKLGDPIFVDALGRVKTSSLEAGL